MRRKGQCLLKGSGGTPRMGLAEQNSCRITMLFRKNHDFRFHLTCWAAPTLLFLPTLVNTSVPIRDRKWDEGDFSCGNIMGWWVWAKTVGLMGMGQEKCCRCQTTPKKKLFVKWSILAPFSYSQFLSALPSFWLFLVGWLWFIFLLAGSGLIIISRNIFVMLPSQNLFEWYHYLLPVNTHTVSHVLVLPPWLVSKSPRPAECVVPGAKEHHFGGIFGGRYFVHGECLCS